MDNVHYIQVILPLRLPWLPWYKTQEHVHVGQRVEVSFARKKYIAVVYRVLSDNPEGGNTGPASTQGPCSQDASDARRQNIPASSQSPCSQDIRKESGLDPDRILPVTSTVSDLADITEEELRLWKFLSSYYMCTLGEVCKAAYPLGKREGEEVSKRMELRSEQARQHTIESLTKKLATLESRLAKKLEDLKRKHREDIAEKLKQDCNAIEKRINELRQKLDSLSHDTPVCPVNSSPQGDSKPLLIVGANREDQYREAITRRLSQGYSALLMEPENGFAASMLKDFSQEFPTYYYTSSTSTTKKRDAIEAAREGVPALFVGTRSVIFLPFHSLGLIIVDEEQDSGYKQQENGPLFNGRDAASVLAQIHGASLILGSPCPSLESLYNHLTGKYQLVQANKETVPGRPTGYRGRESQKPQIDIISIPAEKQKRGMAGNYSFKALKSLRSLPRDAAVDIVRCFQNEEDAKGEAAEVLPELKPRILTARARQKDEKRVEACLILQADALFDRDNFRADERALQTLYAIALNCKQLIIQTSDAAHPVFSMLKKLCDQVSPTESLAPLMDERKQFSLPPYTRLVDVISKGRVINRISLPKDSSLATRKKQLQQEYPDCNFDADPL